VNIEVRTVKMTKTRINQFRHASLDAMQNGELLGFVINCRTGVYKAYLFKHFDDYYFLEDGWYAGCDETTIYRKQGKWLHKREFKTPELHAEWLAAYQNVKQQAKQVYL
jgi:hypothetical protein